jgi:hypothetical protein
VNRKVGLPVSDQVQLLNFDRTLDWILENACAHLSALPVHYARSANVDGNKPHWSHEDQIPDQVNLIRR